MEIPARPPLPDLNDEQIQILLGEVAPRVKTLMEGVTLALDYYGAGGRDRPTWDRICDGLGHEAMNLMIALSGPAHPYNAADSEAAIRDAAGIEPRTGGMGEALHQKLATGVLMSVITVGQQHLIQPEDWPEELPAVVLGAVRRAPAINEDPLMTASKKDRGFPL